MPVQSPTATAKQQLENARRELAAKGHKVVVRPASTCIAKGSLFMCSSMSAFPAQVMMLGHKLLIIRLSSW